MRFLAATAVTAWVTPSPMNILREGSYWKCRVTTVKQQAAMYFLTREQNPE